LGRRGRYRPAVLLLLDRQLDLVIVALARHLVFEAGLLGSGSLSDRINFAAEAQLGGRSG
jgi:hypothetical protein